MSGPENYLFFNGTCADAMRFYERTLGGKMATMMTHGDMPGEKMPGDPNRIMHARLVLDGGGVLMASDAMEGKPYAGMNGFSLSLSYPTVAEGQKIFNALADGGEVRMAYQKTFWIESFGMVVDRFGTPWMINGGKPSM